MDVVSEYMLVKDGAISIVTASKRVSDLYLIKRKYVY